MTDDRATAGPGDDAGTAHDDEDATEDVDDAVDAAESLEAAPGRTDDGDEFEAELRRARELLDQAGIDGLYLGVTRDDELDFTFAHRADDADRVGLRALSLLAQHLRVIAAESGIEVGQVADDAVHLAEQFEDGGSSPQSPDG